MKIYGYCRISRPTQSILRQVNNIEDVYGKGNVIIIEEAFTGTKLEGRDKWNRLFKNIKSGEKIIFDSVSRMSRNAEEGILQYMELFDRGVELEFIKEPHINTATYRKQIEGASIPDTDSKIVNLILKGVVDALKELAKEQIRLAFNQSEKEVMDLRQRTKEGIERARATKDDLRIGTEPGRKLTTKKSVEAKEKIKKHAKDFGGSLTDKEVMEMCRVARNSYYKYKREIVEEMESAKND